MLEKEDHVGKSDSMNLLFVHQNHPGQYREVMPKLVAEGRHKVVFLTQREVKESPGYPVITYKPDRAPAEKPYGYTEMFESCTSAAVGAMKACLQMKARGYKPDLIVGHAGWGELMLLKEVWPDVPVVGYFEYYFIAKGGLINSDPEFPSAPDISAKLIPRNANNILNLINCDAGYTASEWQRWTHPEQYRSKIDVIHEGIRTDLLTPDHTTAYRIKINDVVFSRDDEIVTYIARNLEPARGVHTMLRSLPKLQRLRPNARLAVIGGDGVSYGARLGNGKTFRQMFMEELGDRVDWSRVHFLGQIPYEGLIRLLRLAKCHIYLTVPFVVSWSFLESMALEKTIVASDVAPIRQFAENGKTAFLVDFFDPNALALKVADVLRHPDNYREIGMAARRDMVERFDFHTRCYPDFMKFLDRVRPGVLSDTELKAAS